MVEQGYQLRGRGERGPGAPAGDLRGDAAREALLAVAVQDVGQRRLVVGVHDVGRGQRRRRIHPHVQRCVLGVREAAFGAVELHGGHAEVEEHAVDGFDCGVAGFGQGSGDVVIPGLHQRDSVGERGQPLPGDVQRAGVAVEPDQPQAGKVGEEALCVPGRAEGGVDQDRSRAVGVVARQSGGEQLDAAVQQDGHVAELV